jgi:hypothetical protein
LAGNDRKLTGRQEIAIAALLEMPTVAAAAEQARIGERTLRRWLKIPAFLSAYRRARHMAVENAIARIQGGTGQAVTVLLAVAKDGLKDRDRMRAAIALLDYALRGVESADILHRELTPSEFDDPTVTGPADVVKLLAERLRQLEKAELPTGEKSRLTAALAGALLRAIGVDVLDQRLEALQAVLKDRKDDAS